MKKTKTFISLLLSILLISSADAGIEECEKAYNDNNFSIAYSECNDKNLHSNGRAVFIVASMIEKGQGVRKNAELACRNFLKAGRLAYCQAYTKISKCYRDGLIVEGSILTRVADAQHWEKKAKNCSDTTESDNYQKGLKALGNIYWTTRLKRAKDKLFINQEHVVHAVDWNVHVFGELFRNEIHLFFDIAS